MPEHAAVLSGTRAEGERRNSTQPATRDHTLPITLLAFVLRLIAACVAAKTLTAISFFNQATELGCLAHSVTSGRGLSSPFCGHTGPSAFLAPGYPLFIAGIFRIFGDYSKHSAVCIILLQSLFSTLTVPVAMWAARRAFGSRAANIAGILCAINPWLIGMESIFWETSFSIFTMTTLVALAVALQQKPTRARWWLAALVLALGVAVNPSIVLTGLALFVLAAVLGPRDGRRAWIFPAIFFIALSSLWPARNLRVMHAFIPLRDNLGYELWQGNRPGANGFFDETLHPNNNRHQHGQYVRLGELAYMQQKSQLAKAWIGSHPGHFTELILKRLACFWLGIRPEPSVLLILSTTTLSLAGLVSLWRLLAEQRRLALLFATPLLVLPLPYYFTHPDFRFWCLLAPTLSILAAWGLQSIQRSIRRLIH